MTFRLKDNAVLQDMVQRMQGIGQYVRESGMDHNLLELMSMRTSQINGCAYCLARHTKELREAGEREDRLAVLSAWRETNWFTDRERAALAWAEAVTTLEHREVPDDVYEQVRAEFSEKELAELTWTVIATNTANRFSIAFHYPPVPFTIDANEVAAAAD